MTLEHLQNILSCPPIEDEDVIMIVAAYKEQLELNAELLKENIKLNDRCVALIDIIRCEN